MDTLDNYDLKLLAELQRDGALSVEALAERIGLSKTPCWRRIARLRERGVIARTVTLLDPVAVGLGTTLFVHIKVEKHDADLFRRIDQALCLMPNADSGHSRIRGAIEQACADWPGFRTLTHLPRPDYVSLLAGADLLVGNSSSGIVEAASFGTPVVNVGDRQAGRERNANTVDCEAEPNAVAAAIMQALRHPRTDRRNVYGDGRTDRRIAELLAGLRLDDGLLKKTMSY